MEEDLNRLMGCLARHANSCQQVVILIAFTRQNVISNRRKRLGDVQGLENLLVLAKTLGFSIPLQESVSASLPILQSSVALFSPKLQVPDFLRFSGGLLAGLVRQDGLFLLEHRVVLCLANEAVVFKKAHIEMLSMTFAGRRQRLWRR